MFGKAKHRELFVNVGPYLTTVTQAMILPATSCSRIVTGILRASVPHALLRGNKLVSNIRVVAFDGLLHRLAEQLGQDSLLYQRFDFALRHKDENAIDSAMQSLSMYPEQTREAVENAMLGWLFGSSEPGTAANSNGSDHRIN